MNETFVTKERKEFVIKIFFNEENLSSEVGLLKIFFSFSSLPLLLFLPCFNFFPASISSLLQFLPCFNFFLCHSHHFFSIPFSVEDGVFQSNPFVLPHSPNTNCSISDEGCCNWMVLARICFPASLVSGYMIHFSAAA